MWPQRLVSWGVAASIAALFLLAAPAPARGQTSRFGGSAEADKAVSKRAANMWKSLQGATPTIRGSLRLDTCGWSVTPDCGAYLIQALEYHWEDLRPNELVITDLGRQKTILVDRDVDFFLYMFPLAFDSAPPSAGLLATVWGTGTSTGVVRIYLLQGDTVTRVFYDGTRFAPQFMQSSDSTAEPVVLLDLGYEMHGNTILPTETEIWQWNPAAKKFLLRATVPVGERFAALAKLEREAKEK